MNIGRHGSIFADLQNVWKGWGLIVNLFKIMEISLWSNQLVSFADILMLICYF